MNADFIMTKLLLVSIMRICYLKATEIEGGLLLNFGPKPEFRRKAFDISRKIELLNPRSSDLIRVQ